MRKEFENGLILNIFREAGILNIFIDNIHENPVIIKTDDGLDIDVSFKKGKKKDFMMIKQVIPKKEKLKTNINDIHPWCFKVDTKNYAGTITVPAKYFFNKQAADKQSNYHNSYIDKVRENEAKQMVYKSAHSKDSNFTNYSTNNLYKPYQGGLCTPK